MANLNLPYFAATAFLESKNLSGAFAASYSVAKYGLMTVCGQAITQLLHWMQLVESQTGI